MTRREVREGRLTQGVDEKIAYALNTTPWGGSPSSVSVVVKDATDDDPDNWTDVTATQTNGSAATVSGNVITLPKVQSLANGSTYRVEVKFTTGGNVVEAYANIDAEL
jgi:hypothetical protein